MLIEYIADPMQVSAWSFKKTCSIRYVVIEPHVLAIINRWRQHELGQSEACGILLGERRGDNGSYIRITHLTEPYATDQRSRMYYQRNLMGHQQFLDALHRQSNGEIQYLGEWHTHPQQRAIPSTTDYLEWAKTSNLARFCKSQRVFLIAGTAADWLGVIDCKVLSVGIKEA